MKKILCIVLIGVFVFLLGGTVFATLETECARKLSQFKDEECIAFLKEYGITIPDIYASEIECLPFVRAVIESVETNASLNITFRDPVLLQFANEIYNAVNLYYGQGVNNLYDTRDNESIIQDSTRHGAWLSEYQLYNCYGYAIEKKVWLEPGFSLWVTNGNEMGTYYYNDYANMYTISQWVKADLEYYDYTVSIVSTTMPDTVVSDHTRLICVRKDLDRMPYMDMYGDMFFFHDFHFMYKGEDGFWYHKPGGTNPLRYKYTPSTNLVWVMEGYNGAIDAEYRNTAYTYDSEIYFIEYTTPHAYAWKYCGSNKHIRTCTICGETEGLTLICRYNSEGVCTMCGHFNGFDTADSIGDETMPCDHA